MTQAKDEGLLARWSRRKQQSTLESQQDDPGRELQTQELANQEINQINRAEPGSADELEEVPVLTDADMPPVDTLTEESDFSGFMSSGVSDELRNLALRKLFGAPSFNIRDGLDEYDEDYTYFEKLGDIVTADMKHQIELKEAAKEEQQTTDESADESVSETTPASEKGSEQAEAESEMEMSEKENSESDPQISDADLEPQEPIKPDNSENTTQHHD
jgi:hypothetical protein